MEFGVENMQIINNRNIIQKYSAHISLSYFL